MSVSANRLHLRLMVAESGGERWERGGGGGEEARGFTRGGKSFESRQWARCSWRSDF